MVARVVSSSYGKKDNGRSAAVPDEFKRKTQRWDKDVSVTAAVAATATAARDTKKDDDPFESFVQSRLENDDGVFDTFFQSRLEKQQQQQQNQIVAPHFLEKEQRNDDIIHTLFHHHDPEIGLQAVTEEDGDDDDDHNDDDHDIDDDDGGADDDNEEDDDNELANIMDDLKNEDYDDEGAEIMEDDEVDDEYNYDDKDADDEIAEIMNGRDMIDQRQCDDSSVNREEADSREEGSTGTPESSFSSEGHSAAESDRLEDSDVVIDQDQSFDRFECAATAGVTQTPGGYTNLPTTTNIGETIRQSWGHHYRNLMQSIPAMANGIINRTDKSERESTDVDGKNELENAEKDLEQSISEASSIDTSHSSSTMCMNDVLAALHKNSFEAEDQAKFKIDVVDNVGDDGRDDTKEKLQTEDSSPIISSQESEILSSINKNVKTEDPSTLSGISFGNSSTFPAESAAPDTKNSRLQRQKTTVSASQPNDEAGTHQESSASKSIRSSNSLAASEVLKNHKSEKLIESPQQQLKDEKRGGILRKIRNSFKKLNCRKHAHSVNVKEAATEEKHETKEQQVEDRQLDLPQSEEQEPDKIRMIDEYLVEELLSDSSGENKFLRASKLLMRARELMDEAIIKQQSNLIEAKALTTKAHTYGYVSRQLTKEALLMRHAVRTSEQKQEKEKISNSTHGPFTENQDDDDIKSDPEPKANTNEWTTGRTWIGEMNMFKFEQLLPSCFTTCTNPTCQRDLLDVEESLEILAKISEDDPNEVSTHSRSKSNHPLLRQWLSAERSRHEATIASNHSDVQTNDRSNLEASTKQYSAHFLKKNYDFDDATKRSSDTKKSFGNQSTATKNTIGDQSVGTTFMMDLVDNIRTFYNTDIALSLSTGFSNDREDDDDDDYILARPVIRRKMKQEAHSGTRAATKKSKSEPKNVDKHIAGDQKSYSRSTGSVLSPNSSKHENSRVNHTEFPKGTRPKRNSKTKQDCQLIATNDSSQKQSKWRMWRLRK